MRKKRVEIVPGFFVNIASEAEAERADFVACGPRSYFSDDVHTTCARCLGAIVHRPSAPKRPPKVCVACALVLALELAPPASPSIQ